MSVHQLDSLWKTCYLWRFKDEYNSAPALDEFTLRKDGRVQGYEYPGQGPGGKHDSVVTPDTVLTKVEGWPHTAWEIVLNAL